MPNRNILTLVVFAFIIGLFSGYIYRSSIEGFFSGAGENYYCPDPTVLVKQSPPWVDQNLKWSFSYQDKGAISKLMFFQAVFELPGNKLSCYYRWSQTDTPGTYGNLMIQLAPSASDVIAPSGDHWQRGPVSSLCQSGNTNTCAFTFLKRI